MVKIKINKKDCTGCGLCSEICSKSFEMKNGKAKVKKSEISELTCEKEAADCCPASAIKIV